MCPALVHYRRFGGDVCDLSTVPSTLQKLEVECCDRLSNLHLNKGLQYLSLISVEVNDAALVQIVTMCPILVCMVISDTDSLTSDSIALLGNTYSKTMRSLTLKALYTVEHTALEQVCKKCSGLHSLDISENDQFAASACEDILNWAPNLHQLEVRCMSISDAALKKIAQSELNTLNMYETTGYTDEGLFALMEGCKAMQCIYINDKRINSLVKLAWNNKREIKLIFK